MLDILVRGSQTNILLSDEEERLLELLGDGPVPAVEASEELGLRSYVFLPLKRLLRCGMVKLGGLTPTDLLHVNGDFCRWDRDAAGRGLGMFAGIIGRDANDLMHEILDLVTRSLFNEVVRREISHEDPELTELPEAWCSLLDRAYCNEPAGMDMRISLRHPIVAIGAPAAILAPPLAGRLDTRIIVPEHAEVANAVGAIGSEVVANDEATVLPNPDGGYLVYLENERCAFADLSLASVHAQTLVRDRAARRVTDAGGTDPRLTLSREDIVSHSANGTPIFLERRIRARGRGALLASV